LGARVHAPDGLVVGVEQVVEARVELAVAGREIAQHEALEEPRDVREVPLRRTDVGHRLHDGVLDAERFAERERPAARRAKTLRERPGLGPREGVAAPYAGAHRKASPLSGATGTASSGSSDSINRSSHQLVA